MKITTLLLLSPIHDSIFKWAKQYNHSDLSRGHANIDSKIVKSITPKPAWLKSWNFRERKIRKLYITFVFNISTENIICITKISSQQKIHMQPFQNVTIWCFTCFANKEHAHMSHSRTSTTTNILSNTLLNTNQSKHHQIQLQALSTIMLLLILSLNKHIYIILVIYGNN